MNKYSKGTSPVWGADSLSEFLDIVHRNQHAGFSIKRQWYERLAGIDDCFITVQRDGKGPANTVVMLLFLRTLGAFRAACGAGLAGQIAEAFVLMRSALEAASYALHIERNPTLTEVWINRHENDVTMRDAKNYFKISAVKETLLAVSPADVRLFDMLYQRTIDRGAHPNSLSVLDNLNNESLPGQPELVFLQRDGIQLDHALKSLALVGICCLQILQFAFLDRFHDLKMQDRILVLRDGL